MSDTNLKWGWWGLVLFATLGLTLEALHGFKVGFYLDLDNTVRREMWVLTHTHGTLLSLLNIAWGLTVRARPQAGTALGSACMRAAMVLLPAGFFLGGLVFHDGDPGLGVLLAPVGGVSLLVGLVTTARGLGRAQTS